MNNTPSLITIGLGITLSLIYSWRTGLSSGGLVSAGLLALSLHAPSRALCCIAAALLMCPLLCFAATRLGLHGRVRIGCAMLAALVLRLAVGLSFAPVPWVGWVVPALIASDMQRQGVLETLVAVTTVTCLTALLAQLVFQIGSVIG